MCKEYIKTQMNIHRQTFLMLMNTINKFEQPNTEQADRRCAFSRSFTRMFDRLCAFLDERIGGASELIDACQSVADRFWHSKLYFPVCFMMLAVFMAVGQPVIGGVLFAKLLNLFLPEGKKLNPMIGAAGISAFPMSARIIQKMGQQEDPQNFLLMHAVGANVSGQIASVIAGGIILNMIH